MILLLPISFSKIKSHKSPQQILSDLEVVIKEKSNYFYEFDYDKNTAKYYLIYDRDSRHNTKTKLKIISKQNTSHIYIIHYPNNIFFGALLFLIVPFISYLFFFVSSNKVIILSIYPLLLYLFFINNTGLRTAKREIKNILINT